MISISIRPFCQEMFLSKKTSARVFSYGFNHNFIGGFIKSEWVLNMIS